MASLKKNGNNYGLVWTDSTRSPRQVRESLKTDIYHKAKKKKQQLEWEYHNGEHDPWVLKWYERKIQPEGISIPDAIEEFITYKTKARGQEGWSKANAIKETYSMRNFARILGDKPLNQLTKDDLERVYYRPSVTSDHTRNSDYISMNTFLNWCIDQKYIKTKPEFRPKKPQSKIPKFIYIEDFAELIKFRLQVIEGDWKSGNLRELDKGAYWTVLGWMVLAGTGLRPIELANLKLSHIEKDSIVIGEDFTTKVRSERRVPLLFEARQAIEMLSDPHYRSLEPFMKDSSYLLGRKPTHSKRKLSEEFSWSWQTRFPGKADRVLYNLKDTFCVRFLTDPSVPSYSGMKLNDLREILGHSSLETTQKYLKAIPFGTQLKGTIFDVDR